MVLYTNPTEAAASSEMSLGFSVVVLVPPEVVLSVPESGSRAGDGDGLQIVPRLRGDGRRTGGHRAELADGSLHREVRYVQRERRADADGLALAVRVRVLRGSRFARSQRAEYRADRDVRIRHIERVDVLFALSSAETICLVVDAPSTV